MTTTSEPLSNTQVQTSGGPYIGRDVTVAGNFIGRDQITAEGNVIIHHHYQGPLPMLTPKAPVYVHVPGMPGHFMGRDETLEQIIEKILSKNQTCLSLQGLPGIGKTTIAVAIARHPAILRHFQHGILWGGLGQYPDVMEILATWAQELGRDVTGIVHEEERVKALKATIGQQHLLLIIDDAWDLTAAQCLCCGGPNCVHLLTTRNQMIARSFATGGQVETLPTLDDTIAYTLLQNLAPEACEEDQGTARRLVERTGGLPLTIELLGGYLALPEHSSFPELSRQSLAELSDPRRRLQLAYKRLGALTNKEVTLQETIALSLDGFVAKEIQAFYDLGAFAPKPQGFDRAAATFVTEANLATLAKLIGRNLVEKLPDDRLTLHQTIADVARSQTEPAAIERHCRFYLDWVNANSNNWPGIEQIYGQIKWAWISAPDSKILYDLLRTMRAFQKRRGLWNDVIEWAKRGLHLAEQQEWQDEVLLCLQSLFSAYEDQEQWKEAIQVCEARSKICRSIGRRGGEASALHALGNIYNSMDQWDEALKQYEAGLAIWQELGDPQGAGRAINNIGNIYRVQGRLHEATQVYEQSLQLKRLANDLLGEDRTIMNIGKVYIQQGNWALAIQMYEDHLRHKRTINDRDGEDRTILNMGTVYSEQGNWQATIRLYEEHLRFKRKQDATDSVLALFRELADVYKSNELWEEAIVTYGEALSVCRKLGERDWEGRILNSLGTVYQQQQRWEDAIRVYTESRHIKQEIGNHHIEGITLRNLGNVYDALGQHEKALGFWQEALAKLHWNSPQYQQLTERLQKISLDG